MYDNGKQKKKYDNVYLKMALDLGEIQIEPISLNFWQTPDGNLRRCYVSGKSSGEWMKLGWVSDDKVELQLDGASEEDINEIVKQARALIVQKGGAKKKQQKQQARSYRDEIEEVPTQKLSVGRKKARMVVGEDEDLE